MDFQLPNKYRFLKVLGEGRYGQVLECEDVDSMQIVAVKIPTSRLIETEVEPFVDLDFSTLFTLTLIHIFYL